jgi:hypothetical protein
MTELSPAQAVLDAAYKRMDDNPHNEVAATLAAALEAAADQVVPTEEAMPLNLASRVRWDALQSVRDQLLAIAAELKTHD